MKRSGLTILLSVLFSFACLAHSECKTERKVFFEKPGAKSWQTTICKSSYLQFHTHQTARIIIPDQDGKIKVLYKNGSAEIVNLKKGIPSYLPKSEGLKLHKDINLSDHNLRVIVIEIK